MARRRRKVRVDLRKNREKRSRTGNLARIQQDDPSSLEDLRSGERISGKGNVSRRRTIIAERCCGDPASGRRRMPRGPRPDGDWVTINVVWNSMIIASSPVPMRKLVRNMARDHRNVVVAGDRVQVREIE